MEATLVLFADAANLTEDGKLNLLGEFNILLSDAPPWGLVGRSLVARLEGHAGDVGHHTVAFRLLDQDRQLAWASGDSPFEVPKARLPGSPTRHLVIVALPPILLHHEGPHVMEILVDGTVCGSGEFHCIRHGDLPGRAQR